MSKAILLSRTFLGRANVISSPFIQNRIQFFSNAFMTETFQISISSNAHTLSSRLCSSIDSNNSSPGTDRSGDSNALQNEEQADDTASPLPIIKKSKRKSNDTRFRQHVNPLARKYQIPIQVADDWVEQEFSDPSLPLHLDIGCGKGGFLLDLATDAVLSPSSDRTRRNYLGLEIRPSVAEYAQARVDKWKLSGHVHFIGCNANVDLDRLLSHYTTTNSSTYIDNNNEAGTLDFVTIQFPDPHFKKRQVKRRVVNSGLILTLAKFMGEGTTVFLQSDVKDVLDDMRTRFRDHEDYFVDQVEQEQEYLEENPLGIATERELSVLKRDLPVYRTTFRRTGKRFLLEDSE